MGIDDLLPERVAVREDLVFGLLGGMRRWIGSIRSSSLWNHQK